MNMGIQKIVFISTTRNSFGTKLLMVNFPANVVRKTPFYAMALVILI